ncbi:MAG: cell division protein FtsL [Bdellovibrionaceae bacterium]|nr:cell division protein FtsL [Pseudobdellovibrionaceae bacterium]
MSPEVKTHVKPFLSISFIVVSLLVVVFFQMEERRMGYSLLKIRAEHKKIQQEVRSNEVKLAKILRPQRLEEMAQARFTLKKADSRQIIYLNLDEAGAEN